MADEVAQAEGEAVTEPLENRTEERQPRTPGFSRMRLDWSSDDRPIIQRAKSAVEGRILTVFSDAYEIMNEIYEAVRTPECDQETGEIQRDRHGFVVWKRGPSGRYEEDFNRLSRPQREHLMFLITSASFEWEQRAADLRLEALMAKGQFEERFAIGFDAPATGTVDDRRAAGTLDARDERYFAIFMSALSHRADALVRAMTGLEHRLRDSLWGTGTR